MPTRKELKELIKASTCTSFMEGVPLNKTAYSTHDANEVQLQAVSSYHGLMQVDEILCKLNAATTNISSTALRAVMRSVYMQTNYHNEQTFNLVCLINTKLGERTTIGRNQAIHLLLEATLELLP